jgi:hypothetical protein
VRKNSVRGTEAMSEAAYVDQAAMWAKRLTQTEARGPGDMENAWRRLEARYGVSWRTFWALRYRRPREITAYLFDRLKAAHAAECERQMRRLQHDIEITKAIAGPDAPAVRAAEALVGEDEG